MDREQEIRFVMDKREDAINIEFMHRWYYDFYTNPDIKYTTTPIEDAQMASGYKALAAKLPNWRYVLHVASELGLWLPDSINLKRYTKI